MKSPLLTALLICSSLLLYAQNYTQTIRGTVSDKDSKQPLIGATVVLLGTNPPAGTTTDATGSFRLEDVPVGRQAIQISYIGYNTATIKNLNLSSAKETVLDIELEEKVYTTEEVVVTAERDKQKAENEMATVSARSFTVEETKRYAGSLYDPSRMVMNYAGVASAGDSRNDIIIRGNSPLGVLWRLDGINIPNPNHFGSLGTTGGPISILNNNLLDNSDFYTGAFPAEFGNALAGAFDLEMRTGNNEEREYWGQVGMNGFELGAEGPFSKEGKASYLASYRYSTLEVFDAMNIRFGVGSVPQYQDASFKVDVPGIKYGRFSVFGIGGTSYIELLDSEKEEGDWSLTDHGTDTYYGSDMGVVGMSHLYFFNETTRLRTNFAISGSKTTVQQDSLSTADGHPVTTYGNESWQVKYSPSMELNKKFNAKNLVKAGVIVDVYDFNYSDSTHLYSDQYRFLRNSSGQTALVQAHAQWKHRFTNVLSVTSGLHYQQLTLNDSYAVEPRAGLRWNFSEKQTLNAGVGLHSQIQPLSLYFYETHVSSGEVVKTNKDLDFSKSMHYVLGYNYSFNPNLRLKSEVYYQSLFNVPVENKHSVYSTLNAGADFGIPLVDSLVNEGKGENYGVELTFEKFFSKNYYFLLTTSLFESKYEASDGKWRNTAFNGNYVFNFLVGGEMEIDKKKGNVLSLDLKTVYAGGKRYIPIDLEASRQAKETVYEYDRAYEPQYKPYFRIDARLTYTMNMEKVSQELSFDVQNVTGHKNIFQRNFNSSTGEMVTEYQLGFFPVFLYRILF